MYRVLELQLSVVQRRWKRVVLCVALALVVVTHATKTVRRNIDWESENSLFRAALTVTRNNAKCFNNVGHSLENMQRHGEALLYFQKAASVQPDDLGAHMNIGRALKNIGRYDEAEVAYRRAISLMPPVKPGSLKPRIYLFVVSLKLFKF